MIATCMMRLQNFFLQAQRSDISLRPGGAYAPEGDKISVKTKTYINKCCSDFDKYDFLQLNLVYPNSFYSKTCFSGFEQNNLFLISITINLLNRGLILENLPMTIF